MEDQLINSIITTQIGSKSDHELITSHMSEYFQRFGSYKGKFTELQWYHIFLDFLDKVKEDNQRKARETF